MLHKTPKSIRPNPYEPKTSIVNHPFWDLPTEGEILERVGNMEDFHTKVICFQTGERYTGTMQLGDKTVGFETGYINFSGKTFFDAEFISKEEAESIEKKVPFGSFGLHHKLHESRKKSDNPENIRLIKIRDGTYDVFNTEKDTILQSQDAKDKEVHMRIRQQREERQ